MVTLVSTSKTFNVAALHAATGIVPNSLLWEHFTRAINKYEVAEPNLLAIPGTIAAYLVWIDVSAVTNNSAVWAEKIREQTGLIINPGTYYHGNGSQFICINIAYPRAQVQDGLERIATATKKYLAPFDISLASYDITYSLLQHILESTSNER